MHEDNDDSNEPMDNGEEEQEFELEAIDHDDETKEIILWLENLTKKSCQ